MTNETQQSDLVFRPLILIKGAGEQASGIAARCFWAGLRVMMTEIARPLAIRRTVTFSEAVYEGETKVEGITARLTTSLAQAEQQMREGKIAVFVDPEAKILNGLNPFAVVDAIMAKRNTGTARQPGRLTIGVGPGFTAGVDVDAVIETNRSHYLGRVYYQGSAQSDTGIPGDIVGANADRVIHSPAAGIFTTQKKIGDHIEAGDVVGRVDDLPIKAAISGVLRGLMRPGQPVAGRTKLADIDPRNRPEYCEFISDKALAIGGGVLQAVFHHLYHPGGNHEIHRIN